MPVAWTLRDKLARLLSAQCEVERGALKSIIADRTLPLPVRVKAQLELQTYPRHARPTAIANRCIVSGKARGQIGQFKLHQMIFRQKALAGEIPGVRKASF